MQFDVEFDSGAFYPAAGVVELAEIAEDRGFGAVWKGESNSTDPIVLLAAMASRTKRIQLGTAIYHIFGRSPVTMGIQAATFNDLSDGRLLLGLGVANKNIAGWHNQQFQRPLRAIREYAEIVRAVASGEAVDYQGELYRTGKFKLSWRPQHRQVKILFAGLGEQMTRLAGRTSDGIVVNLANPGKVKEIVANVSEGARQAGRDPAAIEYVIKVRVVVNRDREVARAKLKQVLTFYNLADHYKDMVVEMGFGEDNRVIQEAYQSGGFKAAQAAVSDRLLDNLPTIAATSVDEVRERVQPWIEAGATRLLIPTVPVTDDPVAETKEFLRLWKL
jgi:probable F420-dependent oxidoreductase